MRSYGQISTTDHQAGPELAGSDLPQRDTFRTRLRNATIGTTKTGQAMTLGEGLGLIGYDADQVTEQLWVMPIELARSYLADLLAEMRIDGESCPDPAQVARQLIAQAGRDGPAAEQKTAVSMAAPADDATTEPGARNARSPWGPVAQLAEIAVIYVILLLLGAPAGIVTALIACIVSSLFRLLAPRRRPPTGLRLLSWDVARISLDRHGGWRPNAARVRGTRMDWRMPINGIAWLL